MNGVAIRGASRRTRPRGRETCGERNRQSPSACPLPVRGHRVGGFGTILNSGDDRTTHVATCAAQHALTSQGCQESWHISCTCVAIRVRVHVRAWARLTASTGESAAADRSSATGGRFTCGASEKMIISAVIATGRKSGDIFEYRTAFPRLFEVVAEVDAIGAVASFCRRNARCLRRQLIVRCDRLL